MDKLCIVTLRSLKLLIVLSFYFIIISCNNDLRNNNSRQNNDYYIDEINMSKLSDSVTKCYNEDFFYYPAGINNLGTIAGTISTFNPYLNKCAAQGFLLENGAKNANFINFLTNEPDEEPKVAWILSLSTNNISTGFTVYKMGVNRAMINIKTQPIFIEKFIETSYISENGTYAISRGFHDLEFQLFNLVEKSPLNLWDQTHKNLQDTLNAHFTQVSNNGIAIGVGIKKDQNLKSNNAIGVFCFPTDIKNSQCITIDSKDIFDNTALLHISSNRQWIYGEEYGRDPGIFLLQYNNGAITTKQVQELEGFTIDSSQNNITDTGTMTVVKKESPKFQYIYSSEQHKIFSTIDFVKSLNLNIFGGFYMQLSPNGKYIYLANNIDYLHENRGVKIYFPEGIDKYLIRHVPTINKTMHPA